MRRGDIIHVDLEPTRGKQQAGQRMALIVSDALFNPLGLAWIVPITRGGAFARHRGFTLPLAGSGLDTQGVVLCHQPRSIDLVDGRAKLKERAPDFIVKLVLERLQAVLD